MNVTCVWPMRPDCIGRTEDTFYAVAANTMRRVLIDQARKRKSLKRGHGVRVTLQTGMDVATLLHPRVARIPTLGVVFLRRDD